MSEKTPTKETSGELTQLADFAKQVIEASHKPRGYQKEQKKLLPLLLKKP